MLLTQHIANPQLIFVVTNDDIDELGCVQIAYDKGVARIPRYEIRTPVASCAICGLPLEWRDEGRKNERVACPMLEFHRAKAFEGMANDRTLNRAKRRQAEQLAQQMLAQYKAKMRKRFNKISDLAEGMAT